MDSSHLEIGRASPNDSRVSSSVSYNSDRDQDAIDSIRPASRSTSETSAQPQHEEALLSKEQLNSTHDDRPKLRYRRRTIWILTFYVPLLVLPWVFTCILAVRNIGGGSYITQSGLSTKALRDLERWISVASVLGSINGVATIPLMSALVAQAAVVYGQRRTLKQQLNLRQTIALADRGWSDIAILWDARDTGASSRFLWLAFLFLSISAIQQPLQSLLIGNVPVAIVRCSDIPRGRCSLFGPSMIGHDPEPVHMSLISQNIVVQAITADISSRSEYAVDPYMWAERQAGSRDSTGSTQPYLTQTPYYYGDRFNRDNSTFFAAALPNGTSTGVLRQHALRFNSTVRCEKVLASQFPTNCPGPRPLTAQFFRSKEIDLKVCVPGQYGVNPWNLSRNRQNITEEIYFNVSAARSTMGSSYTLPNFTLHCTTSTTRGYFELGNWYNSYSYGPLEETWPSSERMKQDYNDFRGVTYGNTRPSVEDTPGRYERLLPWKQPLDRFGTRSLNASGPLMNSAIAIFGNGSFFYTAANSSEDTPKTASQICSQNSIPFTRLGLVTFDEFQSLCSSSMLDWSTRTANQSDPYLIRLMAGWTYGWNDTQKAEEALALAVFAANKAMLTKTVETTFAMDARPIYSSPGLIVSRPVKSLPATIVISVLISIHLAGIIYLTWYIYHMPSWSHALDGLAMVRIGAGVRDAGHNLPPIQSLDEKDLRGLVEIDGLIGLGKLSDDASVSTDESERLVLGGLGLVTKDLSGFQGERSLVKRWKRFWRGPGGLEK